MPGLVFKLQCQLWFSKSNSSFPMGTQHGRRFLFSGRKFRVIPVLCWIVCSTADTTQIPAFIDLRVGPADAVGNSRSLPCPFPSFPTRRAKPFENVQGKLPFLSFTHILLIATIIFKAGQRAELGVQIHFSGFSPTFVPCFFTEANPSCARRCCSPGDVK